MTSRSPPEVKSGRLPQRGVIYTAIVGGKDQLVDPADRLAGVDYICFTDDPALRSDIWRIATVRWRDPDPTRTAKRVKILAHHYVPSYSWSLWIDGNVRVRGDLAGFIGQHLSRGSFFAFCHEKRTCLYAEAEACKLQGKDDPDLIEAQISRYACQGMPSGCGLSTNHVLLRRHHDPKVWRLMERWWHEISTWSRRDQLSLPYLIWRDASSFQYFHEGAQPFWNKLPFIERVPHVKAESAPWNPAGNHPRAAAASRRVRELVQVVRGARRAALRDNYR